MDFAVTDRGRDYLARVTAFMDDRVIPAEPTYAAQMQASPDPYFYPPVIEELKTEAKALGLWNLFHPDPVWGAGLTNSEYAPLAEQMGRSPLIAPEALNCNAPDTGNAEILTRYGTPEHHEQWLRPLLAGEIRSAFAMTEPDVASSDATNIELRIDKDGDDYVLNGRKWWTTQALHPNCKVLIVMGKTDPDGPVHRQQSMLVVPMDTPGVEIVRGLPVFGTLDREGHAEISFTDVRVPLSAALGGEGEGFAISQARLGPGRIHLCMRLIGVAERSLELLCKRALTRTTFGQRLADRANIQDWIADSRIELEMARLLVMKTAWLMDTVGNREARTEIAGIKVAVPDIALRIVDRAIQVHGGAGVSDDFPLAMLYIRHRATRIADGPDEVHRRVVALRELRRWESA